MPEGLLVPGDANELAAEIRRLLGVGTYEEVSIVTPQFERPEGRVPPWTPRTSEEFDKLRFLSDKALRFLCLKPWDEEKTLWLYPGEWYESIPAGYPIIDICGEEEPFKPGITDDDIRFGCLPYGFRRAALKAKEADDAK